MNGRNNSKYFKKTMNPNYAPVNGNRMLLSILLFFCAAPVFAQSRLDVVTFNLPDEYQWSEEKLQFVNDSTMSFKSWHVNNNTDKRILSVGIISRDKNEVDVNFKGLKEKLASNLTDNEELILLDEGILSSGYPFTLYKILVNENSGDGSILMCLFESPTSIHICTVGNYKTYLSQDFIAQWSEILRNPIVVAAKSKKIRLTRFVLSASGAPNLLSDSKLVQKVRESIGIRLKKAYKRELFPEDIKVRDGKIYLTLRGDIDQAVIKKLLEKNKATYISQLYRGTAYQKLALKVDSFLKTYDPNAYAHSFFETDPLPAFLTAVLKRDKEVLLSYINKLLKEQGFPRSAKILIGSYQQGGSLFLYLVDTKNKLANQTNIKETKLVFPTQFPTLFMQLDAEGKKNMAAWSQRNVGKSLAIVVAGEVVSVPIVSGPINNGELLISGGFSVEELSTMRDAIKTVYPIPLKVEDVVQLKK